MAMTFFLVAFLNCNIAQALLYKKVVCSLEKSGGKFQISIHNSLQMMEVENCIARGYIESTDGSISENYPYVLAGRAKCRHFSSFELKWPNGLQVKLDCSASCFGDLLNDDVGERLGSCYEIPGR